MNVYPQTASSSFHVYHCKILFFNLWVIDVYVVCLQALVVQPYCA